MKKNAKMKALLGLAFLASLAGGAHAQVTFDEHVSSVRELYGVEQWSLGSLRDGLTLGELELPGLLGAELRLKDGLIERAFTPADAPKDAGSALIVQALVADSAEAAQDQLVLWLAGLTSPTAAPTDSEFGVDLGQAGYVGPSGSGPRAVSWVAFVQGNVAVRLLNADVEKHAALPLARLAAVVDAAVVARDPLATGQAVPKPEIATFGAAASVVAGRPAALAVAVVDPRGGAAAFDWKIAGEGQGYVELRDGAWKFFPTGVGPVTITLTAIGSTGTTATRSVEIDVAHD